MPRITPRFPDSFAMVRCHGNSTEIAEFLPIQPEHSVDMFSISDWLATQINYRGAAVEVSK